MNRTASAQWTGDLRKGKGTMSASSGAFKEIPYSFVTRFENSPGTNPEELIAAAHAGCFTMSVSATLWRAGFTAKNLSTTATVSIEQVGGNWTITAVHLDLTADVPGVGKEEFAKFAAEAKANCPVSRLLKADITLDARLQQA